jgi:hypothetical protein
LALVGTSRLFRILASHVSERQKGILVHNIKFVMRGTMYQRTPIVNAYYSNDSGHYLSHTFCPSKAYADAIMGAGSLEPKLPYERVQMPYLFAMHKTPKAFNVLFRSQINSCLPL